MEEPEGEGGKEPGTGRKEEPAGVEGMVSRSVSASASVWRGMGLERLRGRVGREGPAPGGRNEPRNRVRNVPGWLLPEEDSRLAADPVQDRLVSSQCISEDKLSQYVPTDLRPDPIAMRECFLELSASE